MSISTTCITEQGAKQQNRQHSNLVRIGFRPVDLKSMFINGIWRGLSHSGLTTARFRIGHTIHYSLNILCVLHMETSRGGYGWELEVRSEFFALEGVWTHKDMSCFDGQKAFPVLQVLCTSFRSVGCVHQRCFLFDGTLGVLGCTASVVFQFCHLKSATPDPTSTKL